MPPVGREQSNGQAYWRSLDELSGTPEFRAFMHREFPSGASEFLDGSDRRSFLKVMGASMALAGLGIGGCRRWPEEKIVPYANRPEGTMPGINRYYGSMVELEGVAAGIVVNSYDGRPIKLEGNQQHPTSLGASTAFTQASILDLYDPDRGRSIIDRLENPREPRPSNWQAFLQWLEPHCADLASRNGKGLAFLSEATFSPSVARMQRALRKRFPEASWTTYEPLENNAERDGLERAFGGSWRPVHDFSESRVIVALDADFLGLSPQELTASRQWAQGRQPVLKDGHAEMNRVFVAEPSLTVTGCVADERYSMRPDEITVLAARMAAAVCNDPSIAAPFETTGIETPQVEVIVENLRAHPGKTAVVAGPRQPRFVHHLVALINEQLGNVGTAVSYVALPSPAMPMKSLSDLVSDMKTGAVDTLLIIGGNPVYNAPADLEFSNALRQVPHAVHLCREDNETSEQCAWHLNRCHALECWSDGRAWDGTYSVGQPSILPLFASRSAIELLALFAGEKQTDGFSIVRGTEAELAGEVGPASEFSPRWRGILHAGLMRDSAWPLQTPRVKTAGLAEGAAATRKSLSNGEGPVAVFAADYSVLDGRFANNGWLQELPDPITKLTWDNAVIIGPGYANQLGIKSGDLVRVTVGDASVESAALVETGQAEQTVTLPLGYGRKFQGRVCLNSGFDFYPLRRSGVMWSAPVSIEKIDGSYVLARTQNHWALDSVAGQGIEERLPTLFREADLTTFEKNPHFAGQLGHKIHSLSLWDDTLQFEGARFKWGMSIDLSTCTGCGACVVACQAENNIPIVGKDQVKMGREMSWLRIDRYYQFSRDEAGNYDANNPTSVAIQPMACVMCENAPCEQVCPVAATVHDTDGLNVMVYNRCIGTRYCSNNCPYKVRRFNYFDYFRREPLRETGMLQVQPSYYLRRQSGSDPLRRMQFNPEVTVRMRGVMEKCTYCTQRIQAAKIKAKNEWVKKPESEKAKGIHLHIPDGEIKTACGQACATGAIKFGNLMDPAAEVSRAQANSRSYELLGELNIKPRTKYLAKVYNAVAGERNPDAFHGHGHGHGHDDSHGYGGGHHDDHHGHHGDAHHGHHDHGSSEYHEEHH